MLRDETGAHVSGFELRVAREAQQEVDVGAETHDLKARPRGTLELKKKNRIFLQLELKSVKKRGFLTLYCRKQ